MLSKKILKIVVEPPPEKLLLKYPLCHRQRGGFLRTIFPGGRVLAVTLYAKCIPRITLSHYSFVSMVG